MNGRVWQSPRGAKFTLMLIYTRHEREALPVQCLFEAVLTEVNLVPQIVARGLITDPRGSLAVTS